MRGHNARKANMLTLWRDHETTTLGGTSVHGFNDIDELKTA